MDAESSFALCIFSCITSPTFSVYLLHAVSFVVDCIFVVIDVPILCRVFGVVSVVGVVCVLGVFGVVGVAGVVVVVGVVGVVGALGVVGADRVHCVVRLVWVQRWKNVEDALRGVY